MLGKDIRIYTMVHEGDKEITIQNDKTAPDWKWSIDLTQYSPDITTFKVEGVNSETQEKRTLDPSMYKYKEDTKLFTISEIGYNMNYSKYNLIVLTFKNKQKGSELIKAHSYEHNKELKTEDVTYFGCSHTIEIPTTRTITMKLQSYYVNETLLDLFDLEKEVLLEIKDKYNKTLRTFKGFISKVDEKTTRDGIKTFDFEFKSS